MELSPYIDQPNPPFVIFALWHQAYCCMHGVQPELHILDAFVDLQSAEKEWRFIICFREEWGVQNFIIYLKSFLDYIKWMSGELGTCSCTHSTEEKLKTRDVFCSRIRMLTLIPRLHLLKNRYQIIAHYKVWVKHISVL